MLEDYPWKIYRLWLCFFLFLFPFNTDFDLNFYFDYQKILRTIHLARFFISKLIFWFLKFVCLISQMESCLPKFAVLISQMEILISRICPLDFSSVFVISKICVVWYLKWNVDSKKFPFDLFCAIFDCSSEVLISKVCPFDFANGFFNF